VVVGASGFVGSALVRAATARGLAVRVVGRDLSALSPAPDEVVVNAAGRLTGDDAELDRANRALAEDVGRRCLEAGRPLLHLGSAAEYGEHPDPLLSEELPEAPAAGYGRSKLAGTTALRGLAAESLRVTVARVFNVVGGYDRRTDPVSEFARRLVASDGGPFPVRDPSLVRDLAGVDWVADRVLDLVPHVGRHDVVNVCTGVGTSFGEIIEAMADVLGRSVTVSATDPGGLPRAVGDPARLQALVGPVEVPDRQAVARAALTTSAELTSGRRG
jgi:nucleoside-diphosphate-sugar epimerase